MRYIFLFITIAFFYSCTKTTFYGSYDDKATLKTEVNDFINQWHQAATDADYDTYFTSIASNGIFIGTDEEEVWSKEEFSNFSKPYFDKGKAWDFKTLSRNIYIKEEQDAIWFDETLDTWMGICRGSGVISRDKKSKRLEIQHYVLSITIPNESIQEVIKVVEQTED